MQYQAGRLIRETYIVNGRLVGRKSYDKARSNPDGQANTGHVVVELPKDVATRGKILRALDRLAEEQGYTGDPDDGQRYCYVKLD